jgi:hypothetical protein
MNKLIIIWHFSIIAISLTAQKGLDPQRLKKLEGLIELEIPTESRSWFTDRARVDDYEIAFSKDTFRVERMRCLLINDIFDDLDKKLADTTQNKSDDGRIAQEETKSGEIVAIYEEISKRYDQLIEKYVGLTDAKYPPKLKQKMMQSQNAWHTYRAHVMGLFDATQYAGSIQKSMRLMAMNKARLMELYEFFQDVTTD